MSVALTFAIGSLLGLAAGYYGGWLDRIVGRVVDTITAFSLFVLAMGIVAALGNSIANIVYATAIINLPIYARLARTEANVRRVAGFVEAARLGGNSPPLIIQTQLAPTIMPLMMVQVSLTLGYAILNAAGLLVHRPRRQAADRMGNHGCRRRQLHRLGRMVGGAVPRPRADGVGVLLQPDGRRAARHRRPAAANMTYA